jgi:hypothetical protein
VRVYGECVCAEGKVRYNGGCIDYVEPPKYEAPKYEAPKYETPKYEAPKYEAPKYEAPKYEAPKYEAPKYEAPIYEAPKCKENSSWVEYENKCVCWNGFV